MAEGDDMSTPTTRVGRWMAAHEGHELVDDVAGDHHVTLCRTCDDLCCRDCFPEPTEKAQP